MSRTLIRCILLSGIIALLSGCASSIMTSAPPLDSPGDDKALVTFMRPSMFGGAIQFGLWDGETFIGVLSAGKSIQYLAEPGEHLFMARSENWSYVKADLAAGKKYYILGNVFPGLWKARVALEPVRSDSKHLDKDVPQWEEKLTTTAVIPAKRAPYVQPRLEQVRQAIAAFEAGEVKYDILGKQDGM